MYEDNLYDMLDKVIARTEIEVPESGCFAPVFEGFKSENLKLPIGQYRLTVYKMPKEDAPDEKQRCIEAVVYTSDGTYKANMLLTVGYKDEILVKLKSKDFPLILNNAFAKLVNLIMET